MNSAKGKRRQFGPKYDIASITGETKVPAAATEITFLSPEEQFGDIPDVNEYRREMDKVAERFTEQQFQVSKLATEQKELEEMVEMPAVTRADVDKLRMMIKTQTRIFDDLTTAYRYGTYKGTSKGLESRQELTRNDADIDALVRKLRPRKRDPDAFADEFQPETIEEYVYWLKDYDKNFAKIRGDWIEGAGVNRPLNHIQTALGGWKATYYAMKPVMRKLEDKLDKQELKASQDDQKEEEEGKPSSSKKISTKKYLRQSGLGDATNPFVFHPAHYVGLENRFDFDEYEDHFLLDYADHFEEMRAWFRDNYYRPRPLAYVLSKRSPTTMYSSETKALEEKLLRQEDEAAKTDTVTLPDARTPQGKARIEQKEMEHTIQAAQEALDDQKYLKYALATPPPTTEDVELLSSLLAKPSSKNKDQIQQLTERLQVFKPSRHLYSVYFGRGTIEQFVFFLRDYHQHFEHHRLALPDASGMPLDYHLTYGEHGWWEYEQLLSSPMRKFMHELARREFRASMEDRRAFQRKWGADNDEVAWSQRVAVISNYFGEAHPLFHPQYYVNLLGKDTGVFSPVYKFWSFVWDYSRAFDQYREWFRDYAEQPRPLNYFYNALKPRIEKNWFGPDWRPDAPHTHGSFLGLQVSEQNMMIELLQLEEEVAQKERWKPPTAAVQKMHAYGNMYKSDWQQLGRFLQDYDKDFETHRNFWKRAYDVNQPLRQLTNRFDFEPLEEQRELYNSLLQREAKAAQNDPQLKRWELASSLIDTIVPVQRRNLHAPGLYSFGEMLELGTVSRKFIAQEMVHGKTTEEELQQEGRPPTASWTQTVRDVDWFQKMRPTMHDEYKAFLRVYAANFQQQRKAWRQLYGIANPLKMFQAGFKRQQPLRDYLSPEELRLEDRLLHREQDAAAAQEQDEGTASNTGRWWLLPRLRSREGTAGRYSNNPMMRAFIQGSYQ